VLEAGPEPAGSWARYYDSLTLFSPARYSGMPGLGFPGEPDHYPHRDEVAAYLRRYAAALGADIRTRTEVTAVEADDRAGFLVRTATGQGRPRQRRGGRDRLVRQPLPAVPARAGPLHRTAAARGRLPQPAQHAGERIIVVGGGNSAVQVGYEHRERTIAADTGRHRDGLIPGRQLNRPGAFCRRCG
jgi:putative flavoprotein involved in K+ transport